MSKYPLGCWSIGEKTVGASVWTRALKDRPGEGGGYYLYTWERSSLVITIVELVKAAGKKERQWPIGEKSDFVQVGTVVVPESIREQGETGRELEIGRLIFADMTERFGPMAEWIGYGTDGKPVWFHEKVTGAN